MSTSDNRRGVIGRTHVEFTREAEDPAPLLSEEEKDRMRVEGFAERIGANPDACGVTTLDAESIIAIARLGARVARDALQVASMMRGSGAGANPATLQVAIMYALAMTQGAMAGPLAHLNGQRLGEAIFEGLNRMVADAAKGEGRHED